MTTDLYALCPCGSGKKIKFCCKDIIADVEKIRRMLAGEQRNTASDRVEKLLKKHPDRPILLTLKAEILLQTGELEQVTKVADRLLEIEPDNANGLGLKALGLLAVGQTMESLPVVHRALRCCGGSVTGQVYHALLTCCYGLARAGQLLAACAHLQALATLSRGRDKAAMSLLMQVSASEHLPAILHGLNVTTECPESATWKREFELAIDHFQHGDWTGAAEMLDGMNERILDEPILLRNQATLQAWIGQSEKAAKSFRYLASIPTLDFAEAVDAEACAQQLEQPEEEDTNQTLLLTLEVDDANALMESMLSSDRVLSVPVPPAASPAGPPPKGIFGVWDRPLLEALEAGQQGPDFADLPRFQARLVLFGKETDKPARMIWHTVEDDQFAARLQALNSLGLDFEQAEQDAIGAAAKRNLFDDADYRPAQNTSVEQMRQYHDSWMQERIERWKNQPLAAFDGLSPVEAAKQRKYRRGVAAAILCMQVQCDVKHMELDFDALREALEIPALPQVSSESVQLRSLSPSKLLGLELSSLSDEDLIQLFNILSLRAPGNRLRQTCEEILSRPELAANESIDLVEVHERMSELVESPEEAIEHVTKARDMAVAEGESPAPWLVRELDLRFAQGQLDHAKRLISELQMRYAKEPGIQQMFSEVLEKYGLLNRGAPAAPAPAMAAAGAVAGGADADGAASSGGKLWTPDSDDAADQSEEEKPSKLWMPGMD